MKRIVSLLIVLVMVLCLSACGSSKYEDIIEMLDNKDYNGAIQVISQMAMEEQMAGQEETPVVEVLANTWTTNAEKGPRELTFSTDGTLTVDGKAMTWTTDKGGMATEMQLQIFEDGTHRYLAWFCASDRYAVPFIELSYMEEVDGYMTSGDYIGKYYNHPLVTSLMNDWNEVSDYEKVVDSFWINTSDMTINGDSYDWEVVDAASADQITIHASGKNDVTGEYTMTMSKRGEYPVMTVTDDATGATGLYYNTNVGKDETWAEVVYARTMNLLQLFEENGSFWTNDQNYEDEEAINYLHDQFTACGGYRDSADLLANWDSVYFMRANGYLQRYLENGYFYAGPEDVYYNDANAIEYLHGLFNEIADYSESAAVLADWDSVLLVRANRYMEDYLGDGDIYLNDSWVSGNTARAYIYSLYAEIADNAEAADILDNFTMVPQMCTGAKTLTVDNLGNESSGTWTKYTYDSNGNMIYGRDSELFETYGQTDDLHFYYDENGVMTEIKYAWNPESSVTAVMTPTYDENGNLISISAVYNEGTHTYTFAYDEAGRRISAVINKNVEGGTTDWYIYNFTYTYDDAGRLIEKVREQDDTYRTTTYTYDENGFLIQETMVETYYRSYNGTTDYNYTQTITYTNDELGRPVTAEVTTDYQYDNYKSKTITYTYEDLYFYNEEG